ncbi:hypothetical protein [Hydrogenophilus thiooxidans]|uniref:hypothetical protein n=1 Tax=Hydrogenophilus thiooxidans TaxID=2820326 RepID=UPI001C24F581|nr:hypothetical protein [Hydrogenophilus thiooxidans]
MMHTATYTLTFTTPAFLGDANQNARWRTPPIKHELRHWWRVAYAADNGFRVNVTEMRREEGLLFGNAWLSHKDKSSNHEVSTFSKSLVRIRLDQWNEGKLNANEWQKEWGKDKPETAQGWKIFHPNVDKFIGPALYLGYGPLEVEKVTLQAGKTDYATTLKKNAAIQAGDAAILSMAWPEAFPDDLQNLLRAQKAPNIYPEKITQRLIYALWLMDRFGTLGGRARNGWGSYHLLPSPPGRGEGGEALPVRPWRDCLNLDWPHAIGKDEKGPLIWQTETHADWKSLMRTLAIVKVGLRTQFRLFLDQNAGDRQVYNKRGQPTGIDHGKPQDRHWLAYPVTHHSVAPWDKEKINNKTVQLNLRLPNQLRFKVRQTASGKLVGVIFHMPHLPPPAFNPDRAAIERVWRCVHQFLDTLTGEPHKRQFCKDADRAALEKQKQQLASVRLQRIPE